MAYIQSNIPSPSKIFNFSLLNFAGGLNNTSNILDASESPDLLNMMFTNDTLMEKRKGQKLYNNYSFTNPVNYIDDFTGEVDDADGSAIWGTAKWGDMFSSPLTNLIIGSGKDVYLNNKKITTFSFDGNISGTQYEGKYFFTDGKDPD
jgi:hypothetical protein